MSEFLESVKIQEAHGSLEDTKRPFCPIVIGPAPKIVAKIGRDNSSDTLGSNLEDGDPKSNHLYEDSEHGQYSAEAHHIIRGNEILGDEKEIEKYLITQNKQTTKGNPGKIENELHDVDWDVNAARNGIRLPYVSDKYRIIEKGKEPDVWRGQQTKESGRKSQTQSQRNNIAYIRLVIRPFKKGIDGRPFHVEALYI